jgi:hypothetical protein
MACEFLSSGQPVIDVLTISTARASRRSGKRVERSRRVMALEPSGVLRERAFAREEGCDIGDHDDCLLVMLSSDLCQRSHA